jgi:hypothetical protein
MMGGFDALRGGMPPYKYVGNRILTTMQNLMLGTSPSEFHSGYRFYSVRTLRSIRFRLNSNDFHFDTEIILQLLNAGARIVERPIPTYYGSEISRVNGIKYDVLRATWANRLHRWGILYQRRYDTSGPSPTAPGCSTSARGRAGSRASSCGRAVRPRGRPRPAAGGARGGDRLRAGSQRGAPLPGRGVRLPAHAGHQRAPEGTRAVPGRLRAQLDYRPRTVVLSTSNIGFFIQRIRLLLGQFNYGRAGILDLTHTRLFTFRTLLQVLDDVGFHVRRVRGVPAPFPKALGPLVGGFLVRLNSLLIRLSRTLFSYQIFVEAETTPDVDFILSDTRPLRRTGAPPLEVANPPAKPGLHGCEPPKAAEFRASGLEHTPLETLRPPKRVEDRREPRNSG